MKKICFVLSDIHVIGGAERAALSLAEALKADCEVHVISLNHSGEDCTGIVSPEIRCHILCDEPFRRLRFTYLQCRKSFRRILRAEKFDAVVLEATGTNFLGIVMGLGIRTKFIVCDHGSIESQLSDRSIVFLRGVSALFADRVVVLTDESLRAYRRIFKTPARKLCRIYNWISPEVEETARPYNPNSRRIISVGRFSPEKRFETIVPIARQVLAHSPDWCWDIYGDGPEFDRVKKAIEEAGMQAQICLKGSCARMNALYGDYGIYVLTSDREGLPLVLLEAKANHLPIVSYDIHTGPKEIVTDRVNGFLVQNQNQQAMAEKILALTKDSSLRRSFAQHAWDNREKFDRDQILKQWKTLLGL